MSSYFKFEPTKYDLPKYEIKPIKIEPLVLPKVEPIKYDLPKYDWDAHDKASRRWQEERRFRDMAYYYWFLR